MMQFILAAAQTVVTSGDADGLIHQLVWFLLVALCVGVVYAMGWYFFSKPPFPSVAMLVWNGLFVLVGGLVIINFLLSMFGHPLVKW